MTKNVTITTGTNEITFYYTKSANITPASTPTPTDPTTPAAPTTPTTTPAGPAARTTEPTDKIQEIRGEQNSGNDQTARV